MLLKERELQEREAMLNAHHKKKMEALSEKEKELKVREKETSKQFKRAADPEKRRILKDHMNQLQMLHSQIRSYEEILSAKNFQVELNSLEPTDRSEDSLLSCISRLSLIVEDVRENSSVLITLIQNDGSPVLFSSPIRSPSQKDIIAQAKLEKQRKLDKEKDKDREKESRKAVPFAVAMSSTPQDSLQTLHASELKMKKQMGKDQERSHLKQKTPDVINLDARKSPQMTSKEYGHDSLRSSDFLSPNIFKKSSNASPASATKASPLSSALLTPSKRSPLARKSTSHRFQVFLGMKEDDPPTEEEDMEHFNIGRSFSGEMEQPLSTVVNISEPSSSSSLTSSQCQIVIGTSYERKDRRATHTVESDSLRPDELGRKRSGSFSQKLTVLPAGDSYEAEEPHPIAFLSSRQRTKGGSSKSVIVKSQTHEAMCDGQRVSPRKYSRSPKSKHASPNQAKVLSPKPNAASPYSETCPPPEVQSPKSLPRVHKSHTYTLLSLHHDSENESDGTETKDKNACFQEGLAEGEGGREGKGNSAKHLSQSDVMSRRQGKSSQDCAEGKGGVVDGLRTESLTMCVTPPSDNSSLRLSSRKQSEGQDKKRTSKKGGEKELPSSPFRQWRDFEVSYIPPSHTSLIPSSVSSPSASLASSPSPSSPP